ncbi:hypothetical protein MUP95_10630, partial [bacterium]|nr:hypothetical protein [bacterium]
GNLENWIEPFQDIPALSAGQQTILEKDLIIPKVLVGQAYIDVAVNPFNTPPEGSRTNNLYSHVITVSDNTPPILSVFQPPHPNSSGILPSGEETSIGWNVSDNFGIDYYDIYYSTDDGASWIPIITGYETESNGYRWTIPHSAITDQARIKIIAYDLGGLQTTAVGNLFQIVDGRGAVVEVLSPDGGESWDLGSQQEIIWTASSPSQIVCFYISLCTTPGGNFSYICDAQPGDQFTYSWTLPPSGATEHALIKITAEDEFFVRSSDVSDNYFKINDADGPPLPPWQVPEVISDVTVANNPSPVIIATPDGIVHTAYIGDQIFYRKKVNDVWQPTEQITNYTVANRGFLEELHMDVDGSGRIHLIWRREDGTVEYPNFDDDLFYSFKDGTFWSTPINLSSEVNPGPTSKTTTPDMVVDSNGNIHVIWSELIKMVSFTTYQKIKSGGLWDSAQVVTAQTHGVIDLEADASGNVHMIATDLQSEIYHNIYNGTSWSFSTLYTQNQMSFQECNIKKGNGNRLHASWRRYFSYTSYIDYAYWNGSAWSTPIEICSYGDHSSAKYNGLAVSSSDQPFFFWIEENRVGSMGYHTLYSRQKTENGLLPIMRISDKITG